MPSQSKPWSLILPIVLLEKPNITRLSQAWSEGKETTNLQFKSTWTETQTKQQIKLALGANLPRHTDFEIVLCSDKSKTLSPPKLKKDEVLDGNTLMHQLFQVNGKVNAVYIRPKTSITSPISVSSGVSKDDKSTPKSDTKSLKRKADAQSPQKPSKKPAKSPQAKLKPEQPSGRATRNRMRPAEVILKDVRGRKAGTPIKELTVIVPSRRSSGSQSQSRSPSTRNQASLSKSMSPSAKKSTTPGKKTARLSPAAKTTKVASPAAKPAKTSPAARPSKTSPAAKLAKTSSTEKTAKDVHKQSVQAKPRKSASPSKVVQSNKKNAKKLQVKMQFQTSRDKDSILVSSSDDDDDDDEINGPRLIHRPDPKGNIRPIIRPKVDEILGRVERGNSILSYKTCLDCGSMFKDRLSLKEHKKTCESVGKSSVFSCFDCNDSFPSRYKLNEHKKVCTFLKTMEKESDRGFTCLFCDKTFNENITMEKHIFSEHTSKFVESSNQSLPALLNSSMETRVNRAYKTASCTCLDCGQSFTNRLDLTAHKRTMQETMCSSCDNVRFSNCRDLKIHLINHRDNLVHVITKLVTEGNQHVVFRGTTELRDAKVVVTKKGSKVATSEDKPEVVMQEEAEIANGATSPHKPTSASIKHAFVLSQAELNQLMASGKESFDKYIAEKISSKQGNEASSAESASAMMAAQQSKSQSALPIVIAPASNNMSPKSNPTEDVSPSKSQVKSARKSPRAKQVKQKKSDHYISSLVLDKKGENMDDDDVVITSSTPPTKASSESNVTTPQSHSMPIETLFKNWLMNLVNQATPPSLNIPLPSLLGGSSSQIQLPSLPNNFKEVGVTGQELTIKLSGESKYRVLVDRKPDGSCIDVKLLKVDESQDQETEPPVKQARNSETSNAAEVPSDSEQSTDKMYLCRRCQSIFKTLDDFKTHALTCCN